MPNENGQLLSHFYLKLSGANAPEDLIQKVLSITVETSLHLPDVATIVVEDTGQKWIDETSLEPGKELIVETPEGKLFDGEIVELEPDFTPSMQRLVIRAYDRLHRLGRGRYARTFLNVTDGDMAIKMAQEAGLQAEVGSTTQVYEYVLQPNETNLSFLQKRAAALGFLLYVNEKKLYFKPVARQAVAATVKWADKLVEFHPRMTTVEQVNSVTVRGWDWKKKQEVVGQAPTSFASIPAVGQSKNGGQVAKEGFSLESPHLVTHRPIREQAQADNLAKAVAERHASRFIEADGICLGNAAVQAGATIKIEQVGTRFSGEYFVTSSTHVFEADQTYKTHFSVSGYNPSTILSLLADWREDPPIPHIALGVVTNNDDPEELGRVKVKFPWLATDHESQWARVATPGGGKERGIEFLPEVNDEVLVAFELGDINHPYVIGYLWNGKDKPPESNKKLVKNGQVMQRIIYSRTGHKIIIDDDEQSTGITLEDKNKNVLKFDTKQDKLFIEFNGDIEMKAKKNIDISAQGNIKMKATGRVEIESGMDVKIKGNTTVDVTASMINLN